MVHVLLIAHIVILGYWLGSEFVINSGFRYVTHRQSLDPAERTRLMDHVMVVDQHVRYALILQLSTGVALAGLLGYLPGGARWATGALIVGTAWLALVEWTHRARGSKPGERLARLDRGLRYVVLATLLVAGLTSLLGITPLPGWLAWKLVCFAGVMACGVGIRLVLLRMPALWATLLAQGSTPELERRFRSCYWSATRVLLLLWLFIGLIVWLSVWKPIA